MMIYPLLPPAYKVMVEATRRICISLAAIIALFGLILVITGQYESIGKLLFLLTILESIPLLVWLIEVFPKEKVSQSYATFASDRIQVFNKQGRCWREIPFYTITNITEEFLQGFFYGNHPSEKNVKYICIYLNGTTQKPMHLSYYHMFEDKNFFMIAWTESLGEQVKTLVNYGKLPNIE